MLRCLGIFFFLIFGLVLPLGPITNNSLYILTSEESPPFNYTDERSGKFVGLGTELVEEMFKRAGLKYTISPLPWIRAYNDALIDNYTCVFMAAKTEERLPLFKWVGPFLSVEWVIYGAPNSKHKVSNLEELKKLRLGGYIGDAPVVFLQKQGFDIDLVSEDTLNPKKLQLGRIDGWITNSTRGPLLAKKIGVVDIKKIYTIKTITHYMACNKQISNTTIELLNRELQVLKSQGFFDRVIKKYEEREKVDL